MRRRSYIQILNIKQPFNAVYKQFMSLIAQHSANASNSPFNHLNFATEFLNDSLNLSQLIVCQLKVFRNNHFSSILRFKQPLTTLTNLNEIRG